MGSKKEFVYAFDFGTGSLGEAVRKGDVIIDKASLLIDEEVAKIAEQRKRRRADRTRKAHMAREKSLKEICKKVGIPTLDSGDERMLRQFPEPGDDTCYTSCLLRIKLLRGKKLEDWQVYKSLHSAIQRRGYDPNVDWENKSDESGSEDKKTKSEEEKKFEERKEKYKEEIDSLPADCRYPCYYDAWKMGLWDPKKKNTFRLRIDCCAERARDKILLREHVIAEVKALLAAAEKFYPKIKSRHDEIMFGKGDKPYASFYPELRKRPADGMAVWGGERGG